MHADHHGALARPAPHAGHKNLYSNESPFAARSLVHDTDSVPRCTVVSCCDLCCVVHEPPEAVAWKQPVALEKRDNVVALANSQVYNTCQFFFFLE